MKKSLLEELSKTGYSLVNDEKLNRAVYGTLGREGKLEGGVGEDASVDQVLAEYDRLGGLVLKGNYKVKTGAFYDFEERKARSKPVVVFEVPSIAGGTVDVPEDEEMPMEAKAFEIQEKSKKVKKVKKVEEE